MNYELQKPFGLYLVITNPTTSYEACAEAAVKAKLRVIQLRMKDTPRDEILQRARNLRAITSGTHTLFIVNDDPQLAVDAHADGVHLGQDDMPLDDARRRFPSLNMFGLSTHSYVQMQRACESAPDYIGVGPVFPTPTKKIPDPSLGVAESGRIIEAASVPAVAIGGIDETNLRDVIRAGAKNYCVVRAVCGSAKPYDAIRRLQDIWAAAIMP